jgi:hypothetical protein
MMHRSPSVRAPLIVAALAAVSVTGMAGIASAATTPVRSTAVVAQQPLPTTSVASKRVTHGAQDAFSAGIAGYDDATCGGLLDDLNTATDRQGDALAAGDQAGADKYGNLAGHISDQMFDNCAVIT